MAKVEHFKDAPDPRAPNDVEAEQVVLGCLMVQNKLADLLGDQLTPDMFYEPTHGRIFSAILALVQAGRVADPVTVNHGMGLDAGFTEMGGKALLSELLDKAPPASAAKDHANAVRLLWQRRELIKLGEETALSARNSGEPDDIIDTAEKGLLEVQMASTQITLVSAAEAIDRVEAQLQDQAMAFGVKIGIGPVDDITGGFMPGELWLGAGRPGMGKSAAANCAALNVSMNGLGPRGERLGVIEICSEMTVEQMMRRHIADLCFAMFGRDAPSYSAIRKRSLTTAQRGMFKQAAARIRELGTLKSLYRTGLTVMGLRGIIRRQKAAWARQGISLGLVTIDHMGLVRPSRAMRQRSEAQGEVARDTKEIAGDLNVPILALVQLNRKVEDRDDRRPQLSDLRDSGEWEENADGVIGFYREAYYAQRQAEPRRQDERAAWDEKRSSPWVDAIFMKIREGEMQTVRLWADMARNAIRAEIPANAYSAPLFDPLDADQALPAAQDDASAFE